MSASRESSPAPTPAGSSALPPGSSSSTGATGLAAPFTPFQGAGRRFGGARHTSLHTPRSNKSPEHGAQAYDDHSSAATSPVTVSSSLSAAGGRSGGSTRPSSFEVLRAGRGSLDNAQAVSKRPLFKVRSADSRGDVSWRGAQTVLESKGKSRAAWEVEGGQPPPPEPRSPSKRSSLGSIINGFSGGRRGSDEHSHAGLGIGLTRSFKSGSITGLAEGDSDFGPVFTPLQSRSSGSGEHDYGYASRSLPTDSAKTLRKVASSEAALMGAPVARRDGTPTLGRAWQDGPGSPDPEDDADRNQAARRQRWHSHPADEFAPSSPLPGAGDVPVRHTTHVTQRRDKFGRLLINNYMRGREIGRGVHGVVYIGKDTYCRLDSKNGSQSEEVEPEGEGEGDGEARDEDFLTVAIKVVRRDPRTKSLRRSQQQRQRRQAEEHLADVPGEGKRQLLRDVDDKLKREIAIMKRLKHDNIVRLFEVIDDVKSKKVFMILEFMEGGQVAWQDPVTHTPLMTVEQARKTFRQVVLGLEYLHHQGIIHRDIKPANLLWTADREFVKISDFGVSHLSSALRRTSSKLSPINETRPPPTNASDDRALRKTEGSPAFMAPELCCPIEATPRPTPSEQDALDYFGQHSPAMRETLSLDDKPSPPLRSSRIISKPLPRSAFRRGERPPVGKGIDIWALGVTLYCLLFGKTPFDAPNEYELFNVIWNKPALIPDYMGADRKPTSFGDNTEEDDVHERDARHLTDLLGRLLEKDPRRRITLDHVKTHAWVLSSLERPKRWIDDTKLAEGDTIVVTQDDVANFTQPLTTSPTLTKPLGSVKQSLRKAAIKLGLRASDSSVSRVRTKSVSSTSASACTSPHDAQETTILESLSRHASRTNGHRMGRYGARSPSPSRSPAGKQSPDGSTRRAFSLRHGWHSARATPPQPATPVQHSATSTQIHLTSDDIRVVSGSSTASSGNASPALTRSNSGQHLRTPFQDSRQLRSVPASPQPPTSVNGPGFNRPRAVSPALSVSENEGRHSLKEALSRVKQKLTGHSSRHLSGAADSSHRRGTSQDTRDGRSETASAYGFGDVSAEGSELDLAPAINRERELHIASRIPPPIARDVFYTTEEDGLDDSLSEIDDDEDEFGSDDSGMEDQRPFAIHDGTTLRIDPTALVHEVRGSDLPRPTIAARRLSPRSGSGADYETTPRAGPPGFAVRDPASRSPRPPLLPSDVERQPRSSSEASRTTRANNATPSRRSRSLKGSQKSEEEWSKGRGGDGGQADDEDDAGGLDFEIKSRKRRGTTASRGEGTWD